MSVMFYFIELPPRVVALPLFLFLLLAVHQIPSLLVIERSKEK